MSPRASSPLLTEDQRHVEILALRVAETPEVRQARETARALLLADPIAATPDARKGLDRALDQWTMALCMREANGDPLNPRVVWNVDNTPRTWFGHTYPGAAVAVDNPDNMNREVPLDGDHAYELHGQLSDAPPQLTVLVEVEPPAHAGIGRLIGAIQRQQMDIVPDGRFVVTLDNRLAEGRANHIQLESGRLSLFARDSHADWRQVPAALSIRRLSGPPAPPERGVAEIAAIVARDLAAFVGFWRGFKDTFLDYPEPNRLVGPNGRAGGWGFLAGGRFELGDDEALVVTTTDGGAAYTGFQISDPWTIAPDPIYRTSSLNKAQAKADAEGRYTYVLAVRDPGTANWIDTVGLHQGWFLLRWQGVPADADPASLVQNVHKIGIDELEAVLPPGTPRADLDYRRRAIAERVAAHCARTR